MIINLFNPEPPDTVSGDELGFMATLGHIGKFDPADKSISAYLECVENFSLLLLGVLHTIPLLMDSVNDLSKH